MIQLTSAKRASVSHSELIPEKHASPQNPRLLAFHETHSDSGDCENFRYESLDSDAERLCDELPNARLTPQQATIILEWRTRTAQHQQQPVNAADQSLAMARIIAELIGAEDLELSVNCLAVAAGLDQASALGSQSAIARRLNVKRTIVSRWVTHYKDTLNLTGRFGWGRSARLTAAQVQSGDRHWRRQQGKTTATPTQSNVTSLKRRQQARAGIRTPHAIRNVFERTLRQVSHRQHCSAWNKCTRDAWLSELRPIAEFYSRLSSKNLRGVRGPTPTKESFDFKP